MNMNSDEKKLKKGKSVIVELNFFRGTHARTHTQDYKYFLALSLTQTLLSFTKYNRKDLVSIGLQSALLSPFWTLGPCWPNSILSRNKGCNLTQRSQWKRVGITDGLRAHAHHAPMPSILLVNVYSSENKHDDPQGQGLVPEGHNLLFFAETGMNPGVLDHLASRMRSTWFTARTEQWGQEVKELWSDSDGKQQLVWQHRHCSFHMLLHTQPGAPDHRRCVTMAICVFVCLYY